MVYFSNTKIELYTYNETNTYNVYGEKTSEYNYTSTVSADLQHTTGAKEETEHGTTYTDTYDCYIPYDTVVNESMIVKEENQTPTYTINEIITVNTRFMSTRHKKLVLKRTREPIPLNKD